MLKMDGFVDLRVRSVLTTCLRVNCFMLLNLPGSNPRKFMYCILKIGFYVNTNGHIIMLLIQSTFVEITFWYTQVEKFKIV